MNNTNFISKLKKFEPVTLEALNDKLCKKRFEIKYLLFPHLLPVIIEKLNGNYRVLSINNSYSQEYESLYFDNREFKFYLDHHNGKMNRYKVRFRKYRDAETFFFEIKFKNNKSQTQKWRESISSSQFGERVLNEQNSKLINNYFKNNPGQLFPRFSVSYSRIALIHKSSDERVTIDLNLSYLKEGVVKNYDRMSIAEIKLGSPSQPSDFSDILNSLGVSPVNFSKYCYGIHLFYPNLKFNSFKPRYLFYEKILNERSQI